MATGVCALSATENRSLGGLTVRLYLPGCLLPTVFLWLGVSMGAEAQPQVHASPTSPSTINEGGTVTYDVWLSTAPTADVTVTPTSGNTATVTVSPASLTFTPTSWNQNAKQTVTVTAVENDIDDRGFVDNMRTPDGFGRVTITHAAAGGNYDGVTGPDVFITTLTNEKREITYQYSYGDQVYKRSAIGIWEGRSSDYSISLVTQPWGDTTVTLTNSDPELMTITPTTLKFTSSNWNTPQPVNITVPDNNVDEVSNLSRRAQVKIEIAFSGSESDYTGYRARPFTVNVFDNDIDSTVTPTELTLKEGESDSYTVTLNSEPYVTSSYDYVLDVVPSNKNVTVSPRSLTFTESDWNLPQTVQVTAAAAGSTTISLVSPDIQSLSDSRVAVTVPGAPPVNFSVEEIIKLIEELTKTYPAVNLSVSPNPVVEGSPITVTATLSEEARNSVTIPVNLTTGAADASDFGSLESISIDAGATTGAGTITTTDDAKVELDETFTVSLGELPSSVRKGEVLSLDVTITDDDGSATVTIGDASAAEGNRITFTATVDKAVQDGFSITPSFADGTAMSGDDYTGNASAVNFAGFAGETQSFTVTTTDDAVVEGEETFTVSLAVSGTAAPVTGTGTGIGTITDDDGSAAVTIADAMAAEGDRITFTAAVDKAVQGGFTITPAFADGTATSGDDYTGNASAVSFVGSAGETQSFTVTTTDDAVVEGEESFTVSLTVTDTVAPVTATDAGAGTILDNDGSAAVTITDASAAEGDGIIFKATVDKAVQDGFTITPAFIDGTATFGDDYAGNASTVSFAGTAGETQSFMVTTTEDVVVEGNETFTVSLAVSDTAAPVTATRSGAGTILDDDGSATVTITDARAAEGDRMTFTATVDKAVQGGFTITPSFVDGTATFGADYAGNVSAVSFAGSTGETQSFTVTTTDDAVVEEEETFTVSLAVSATIAPVAAANTGMGTIADDDTARRMGLERLLANVGSLALTSAVDTIDARLSVDDVGASSVNLAGLLLTFDDLGTNGPQTKFHRNGFGTPGIREVEQRQRAGAARRNDLSLDEFLLGSAFTWSLDGSEAGSAEGFAAGAWDRPQWAVWGRGDTQSFNTAPEAGTTYDGELRTAYLGIDTRANRWLAGAALAHSWSDSNYQLSGSGADFHHGRLETMLTAVHPYARWTPSKRTDGWAMLGIGSGEAAHIPDNAESRREKSDLSMRMGAMGLRHTLASVAGGIDMALRADGGAVRLETDDGDRAVNGLSVDSWRVRLGLEVSRPWRIAEETLVLTPFVEAALRADGGDGMVGSGFEVASGVSYSASRIAIELRGRALILQASDFAEDYKERGASLAVVVRPREDGLGFSLTLGPRWGASTRSTGMLWQDAMPRGFGGPAQAQAGYDARLGYGLFSMAAGGLVTPFAEFGDASGREYAKVGARLQLSRPGTRGFQLDAGVSAEYNELRGMAGPIAGRTWTNGISWAEPAGRRLVLDLQMRF